MSEQNLGSDVHEEEEEAVLQSDNSDNTEPLMVPLDLGILDEEEPAFVAPPEMMEEPKEVMVLEEEEAPSDIFTHPEGLEEEGEEDAGPTVDDLQKELHGLSQILEAQSERLMAQNRRAILSSSLFIILVAIYMVWAGGTLKTAFRPEAVADAATGVAEKAIPQAAESLELMLEDGAYDVVDRFGDQVLADLPVYREALVEDLESAKANVADLLATRVVEALLALETTAAPANAGSSSPSESLDKLLLGLDQRLAASVSDAGIQQILEKASEGATVAQSVLGQMAQGRQPSQDREILLSWLSVIAERTER